MLAHSARRIYAFNAMTMLTPERGEPDRGAGKYLGAQADSRRRAVTSCSTRRPGR